MFEALRKRVEADNLLHFLGALVDIDEFADLLKALHDLDALLSKEGVQEKKEFIQNINLLREQKKQAAREVLSRLIDDHIKEGALHEIGGGTKYMTFLFFSFFLFF